MDGKRIEWYIREYICRNGVCEKTKFPLVIGGDLSAHAVTDKRRLRRAEKNATEAKNEAARTANNNFFTGRDFLLTATLSDEGLEELIAKAGTDDPDALVLRLRKDAGNWIRRAKRKMPEGTELKYMAWVSDLDGKRLTPARPHLHVVVNAEGAQALAETWKAGYVYGLDRNLYSANHGDLTDLVEYLMAQSRTVGTEKRYVPSRNLEKPEVSRLRPARNPDAPLSIPKDARLILKSEQRAGRPQKVRYYRESKDRRPGIVGSTSSVSADGAATFPASGEGFGADVPGVVCPERKGGTLDKNGE